MFLGLEEGGLCLSVCRPEMWIHPLIRTLGLRFCPILHGQINTRFGMLGDRKSGGISTLHLHI